MESYFLLGRDILLGGNAWAKSTNSIASVRNAESIKRPVSVFLQGTFYGDQHRPAGLASNAVPKKEKPRGPKLARYLPTLREWEIEAIRRYNRRFLPPRGTYLEKIRKELEDGDKAEEGGHYAGV